MPRCHDLIIFLSNSKWKYSNDIINDSLFKLEQQ
jgi:hypothetical protein